MFRTAYFHTGNDETNLIQVSTSLQMPTANNSFEISKKQTINFEKQFLESLPEVPTNDLENKKRENTKSRKPIQLST